MVRVSIRTASDVDDLDSVAAGDVLWQGAAHVRRTFAAAPPEVAARIFVGELDGECVGVATAVGAPVAAHGYGIASVFVRQDSRGSGVGAGLLIAAERLIDQAGIAGLMVPVPDSEPSGLAFAQHRGYREHGHHIESLLSLNESTTEVARRYIAQAESAGFALDTLPTGAADHQWREAYDFLAARFREAPDSRDGGGAMSFSVFRAMSTEPWMVAVARRGGKLAAITCLMRHATESSRLHILYTGVHPNARGLGLAYSLKSFHAEFCRRQGWSALSTRNMDDNAPILAVNRRLGFEPVAGHRDLGKTLQHLP